MREETFYINSLGLKIIKFRIIDVKSFKNGNGYELLSEEEYKSSDRDFTDKNMLYSLYYDKVSDFLSNELGACKKNKINKVLYVVYQVEEKRKLALISENNEVVFLSDEITLSKFDKDTLVSKFDFNEKYINNVYGISKEEIINELKEKRKTLTLKSHAY